VYTVCSLCLQHSETLTEVLFAVVSVEVGEAGKGQGEGQVLIESTAIYTRVASTVSVDLSCPHTYRHMHALPLYSSTCHLEIDRLAPSLSLQRWVSDLRSPSIKNIAIQSNLTHATGLPAHRCHENTHTTFVSWKWARSMSTPAVWAHSWTGKGDDWCPSVENLHANRTVNEQWWSEWLISLQAKENLFSSSFWGTRHWLYKIFILWVRIFAWLGYTV